MSPVRQLTWPSLRGPPRWTLDEGRACCGQRSTSVSGATVRHHLHAAVRRGRRRRASPRAPPTDAERLEMRARVVERAVGARARTRRGRGPGSPPSTSSRQYGSSLHASSALPPSRERSTSAELELPPLGRLARGRRPAGRRGRAGGGRSRRRRPLPPSAPPRPRGSRAPRAGSAPRPASARPGRRGRRPTPRSCS